MSMNMNMSMNRKPLLNVEHLSKKDILFDLSFTMDSGEMTAVMGPSGSGKSTLLYQLAGMDEPDGGRIVLNGEEVSSLNEEQKADLRLEKIGFVFQQMNMIENLNLRDNILLPASYSKKNTNNKKNRKKSANPAESLDAKADALMEQFSIGDLGNRKIHEVSGGQRQRACICRAMINDPEILMADEPTGALNRTMADEVMNVFTGLNRRKMSVLIVTHDASVASRCDRILYLLDGRICGELRLGKYDEKDRRIREEKVNGWLMAMGW